MNQKTNSEISRASKKKGKKGEKETFEIIDKFSFAEPYLQPGSGSGKNPKFKSDLYIRIKLDEDLKWELKAENKFLAKIGLFRYWKKLKAEVLPNHIPVMTFKENNSDTLIALKLQDFLGILEGVMWKLNRLKKETTVQEINYDNKRAAREIKFAAEKVLREVKKL